MNTSPLLIVLVAGGVTILTRALPFLLFGGKRQMPTAVRYLGGVLPPCIIALLVLYCLKGLPGGNVADGVCQLAALACVVGLHLYKRNTLLSIFGGTAVYMLLIRLPFFV